MSFENVWCKRPVDEQQVKKLIADFSFSPLMARLLASRNIDNDNRIEDFLSPRLKNLIDPSSFKDMQTAVERIFKSIVTNEVIGIFGDYDVDGVCSTAILKQFLTRLNANVVTTLPNRMSEGYGLSAAGVKRLYEKGARLLITVDCGILAHQQIDYANSIGMDVIVVDHHTVCETLPNALAVINPKRSDCPSQADFLCAAGVSFFLCGALRRFLRQQNYFLNQAEPNLMDVLDLVALATVCDVVPLINDNRILVTFGLSVIKQQKRLGIRKLLQVCGIDANKISATNLGFHLGPRINAAGRLEDATKALYLLTCNNEALATNISLELEKVNQDRKSIEEETIKAVCEQIESQEMNSWDQAIVVHDDNFHPGVVGIVASRITELYHRPAIIIGTKGKGSGRSIQGIDLHHMVKQASMSLLGFGGHSHAIGLTLGPGGVNVFREELLKVLKAQADPEVFNKRINYDAEIGLEDIDYSLLHHIKRLEPFGPKNPKPVFRLNRCHIENFKRLNGGHIKGILKSPKGLISFIGFRQDMESEMLECPVDILGYLEENHWQGQNTLQVRLIDYRRSIF